MTAIPKIIYFKGMKSTDVEDLTKCFEKTVENGHKIGKTFWQFFVEYNVIYVVEIFV